jgi:hypothetical protein
VLGLAGALGNVQFGPPTAFTQTNTGTLGLSGTLVNAVSTAPPSTPTGLYVDGPRADTRPIAPGRGRGRR